MTKIFLVYGHYNEKSFNAAIRDTFIKTANENGNEVDCVEIHTGKLSNNVKSKQKYNKELQRIKKSSKLANLLGIEVHAGHGLDYKTTKLLSKIKEIHEYNIGHFIIGESVFHGLSKVIKNFKKLLK